MPADPPPRPFASVLAAFPDLTALARALHLPPPTVLAWKRRDSIPESRWRSIAAAAKDLRVRGVTYATLSAASQAKIALDASASPPAPTIHGDF